MASSSGTPKITPSKKDLQDALSKISEGIELAEVRSLSFSYNIRLRLIFVTIQDLESAKVKIDSQDKYILSLNEEIKELKDVSGKQLVVLSAAHEKIKKLEANKSLPIGSVVSSEDVKKYFASFVRHYDKHLNAIVTRLDLLDTKLDGVSNQVAENWLATHGTKRGRPDKEVEQLAVKVIRKDDDEVIALNDDDEDNNFVTVDVEISSMIPKGTGFAISFKADGVDRDLSICNFFTEFPDFVFTAEEHIELIKKKYESLQVKSGMIGNALRNYLDKAGFELE